MEMYTFGGTSTTDNDDSKLTTKKQIPMPLWNSADHVQYYVPYSALKRNNIYGNNDTWTGKTYIVDDSVVRFVWKLTKAIFLI